MTSGELAKELMYYGVSAIGGTANAGNRDGGDGISNLNSEDIESISILKGAPAAALYGSPVSYTHLTRYNGNIATCYQMNEKKAA